MAAQGRQRRVYFSAFCMWGCIYYRSRSGVLGARIVAGMGLAGYQMLWVCAGLGRCLFYRQASGCDVCGFRHIDGAFGGEWGCWCVWREGVLRAGGPL